MTANPKTLEYLIAGVDTLVGLGTFRNGQPFRPTQGDALLAYHEFLHSPDFTPEQKLKGFFEIPMGVGKTALFLSILDEAHRTARAASDKLRVMIVVPSVAILEQMKGNEEKKGEIEEWAPDYLKTVGYYGGDYRDMGDELTIIIYNSWVTLMEEGLIDSTNIDILVSDEAHRGTSERRLKNQFNAFANGTSQVAFTATARFDEEKSVEQSHGHQIFSRGVGESIRLGELAAYIQTQLHVIRIDPKEVESALAQMFNVYSGNDIIDGPEELEDDEEQDEDKKLKRAIMAGIKQDAWIRDMVSVFRDGRDEHTQEPLTENQSGFYVEGTAMAERLAEVASADPVLQARAKEKGCNGVVAAVHSKMHPALQKSIMAAFERGEYLGIASDSKLKEGYNYVKLKNIFDYPRNSLVDKAQIIGRGARQWWNEAKNRYEGSTVIDTIVYVGSDDPEKDKEYKDAAIRNAVLAWDVLEGTAVYGPAASASKYTPGGGGEPSIEPMYGLNVTSYVSMEDLQAIYSHQQKLQEDNSIPFTEEMREELKTNMVRAGVGPKALFKTFKNPPNGINFIKIKNFINPYAGIKFVDKDEWAYILNSCVILPDNKNKTVPYTKEMKENLIKRMSRVAENASDFIKLAQLPPEITYIKIHRWMNSDVVKTISKQELAIVLNVCENLPPITKKEMIALTKNMVSELANEIKRTGLGPIAFLKSLEIIPDGMTPSKIENWLNVKSRAKTLFSNEGDIAEKRVNKKDWDFVLNAYKKLPDGVLKEMIPFSEAMRLQLKKYMEQIGANVVTLIENIEDLPEGISVPKVQQWLKVGRTKNVDKAEWEAVLNGCVGLFYSGFKLPKGTVRSKLSP